MGNMFFAKQYDDDDDDDVTFFLRVTSDFKLLVQF